MRIERRLNEPTLRLATQSDLFGGTEQQPLALCAGVTFFHWPLTVLRKVGKRENFSSERAPWPQ